MKKITHEQTLELLKEAQNFQLNTKYEICLQTYYDNGILWFTVNVSVGEGNYKYANCYDWRSYEKNKQELESLYDYVKKYYVRSI